MQQVIEQQICIDTPLKRTVCCNIIIYKGGGACVVIVEQLPGYNGLSVTNAIEHIASYVATQLGVDPIHTTWLEHWPPETRGAVEWSLVGFAGMQKTPDGSIAFRSPHWHYISPERVAEILEGETAAIDTTGTTRNGI